MTRRLSSRCAAWHLTLGVTIFSAVPSSLAGAAPFRGAPELLRRLPQSSRAVEIHPYGAPKLTDDGGSFGLFNRGVLSFQETVSRALRGELTSPLIEMRGTPIKSFGLKSGGESVDYRFYVRGVPVCDFQIRAHELRNKSMLVLGHMPEIDPYEPAPSDAWPDLALSLERVTESAVQATGAGRLELAEKSRCLFVQDGRLLPVWSLTLYADGLPYKALADAYETLKLVPAFYDANGTATVYPFNRLDAALGNVALTDLTGDGTLTSTYLKTIVPAGYQPATEPSLAYAYPPTDLRFDEVQVYAHAQTHFDFFKSLGFEWYGPTPLEIKIHIAPAGRPNNALFIPGSSIEGTRPSISIHDGDGVDLQNLVSDGDVVSHEFGHHVIYRTLQSTQGESLVLHEGLADFFAFSRTGDPCLGESICPKGSGACILQGMCLRTAENGLVYNDQLWNDWAGTKYRLGHLHGQLVSGLLWDLRVDNGVLPDDLSKIVLKAVSYFKEDSGLRDLMLGLFTADLELFGGKYATAIQAAGTKRGLAGYFEDVVPGQPVPPLEGSNGALPTSPSPPGEEKHESKGDENPFKCGTIAYDAHKTSGVLLAFLLGLPLILLVAPRPARVKAVRHAKAPKARR